MISKPPSNRGSASSKQRPGFSNLLLRTALVCALTFCGSGPAWAYSLEGFSWPGPTIPMRVQLGPSSHVLVDGSTGWNSVVQNAMALWNEQMEGTQFTSTVVAPGTPVSAGDGVNSMQFSSTIYGDSFGSSVLAVTVGSNSGNVATEADVIFNTGHDFNSYRGSSTIAGVEGFIDLHRVAIHELGHVLGLDHPDDHGQSVAAIMNSNVSLIDHLQDDDVAGAVALYGAPANPPPTSGTGRVAQISTRGSVGTGDNVMIGGFIINGDTPKKVIVRAIGPSLSKAGVAGALADPLLELHDVTGAIIQTNDDWKETQEQDIIDTGLQPTDARESAIVATLDPGAYTAILQGAAGGSGIALVEVYDLDSGTGELANISTRARVDVGDKALIGGFIVDAPQTQRLVIRAIGPSLGLPGALADPTLEVYNSNGTLMRSNDNYAVTTAVTVIGQYGLYPNDTRESAIYFESAPGNFTTIVRGANGTAGIALVEIYSVD
ncbi:MAG: matrixin family metalloprotease [Chthoniobacterales bacterium]